MANLPETNEILNTGLGNGKPYLGSPKVVQGIIREYLHDLNTLRSEQVQRGTDPIPHIKGLAEFLQNVFYGKDNRFQSFAWNRETSLGRALVEDCGIGGDTSDAVFRLGVRIAKEYLRDLIAYENGNLDDAGIQTEIDSLIRRYTMILSGSCTVGEDRVR